jgi:hypothetical protein
MPASGQAIEAKAASDAIEAGAGRLTHLRLRLPQLPLRRIITSST